MGRKVAVITGVSGQDGSYLADFLLAKDYAVVGVLRRTAEFERENIRHLRGRMVFEFADLIDGSTLESLVRQYRPDELYNLASQSVPADSWSQPICTGEITALGPVRILEAIRRHAAECRVYQASTREMFGNVDAEVVNEDTPFRPNNPYGVAKLYAHLMVRTYREAFGMFGCGGILFNHESPRRSLHFVTRKVTVAAACLRLGIEDVPLDESGQPLVRDGKVHLGNLDAKRDWGYACEYVQAMWLMLQQECPRDYVIATNTLYGMRDLCHLAFEHVGLDWEQHVVSDDRFRRPTEIAASRGDYARAKRELGWEPRTTFENLVKIMVDADLERFRRLR